MKKITVNIQKNNGGFISDCPELNEWCDLGKTYQENLRHLIKDITELEEELLSLPDNKLGPDMIRKKRIFELLAPNEENKHE